ncbi:MsnO8 family LLM class oxidoreductase [Neorhizobium galegae]|uniref:MsnO8 family LLM class oxidoreductase n=1 Tax=Neorhizobium galegae TaxID=399 RepID=UPI000622A28E|nr:MsnO8 family LLM class oxidoreductase [Neorhizobium galegae]CDZ67342.1 Luciferase family oxidoreductase, group 1 [Neorhizobium galegae bv. orientalis]MCQ1575197.1 MsnO8 family LLM class oxidoreductase [Neorhizobium galegae]MCQ1839394.1 MsnO8 family LLM class oxidoreductase [Neorhizobium galegae]UIY32476.1 MsnO8 family LLM class oxidoreductase [Neorhizobium galegae]CDZ74030.1 Luciferase family oxidoreductase, group 1 [Neorhizobium galegae bv. orientalis]
MYALSLLDKSPIMPGDGAVAALSNTVNLAKRAEELGYRRFWVAEHHGGAELASSAPEVLVSWILANTSSIRVGSGGVMLQHYSPFKVAEVFNLLSSLAPGRVDLGIGKTPGGLPKATAALQEYRTAKPDFIEQLSELTAFLDNSAAADPDEALPFSGPRPPVTADRFLLGASPDSARLAAKNGWNFVFAGHLNGDPENLRLSLDTFGKESGGKSAILALAAYASENAAHAAAQISELKIFKVFLDNGQSVSLGRREQAEEFARQAGAKEYRIEERKPSVLHGTPESIHEELARLSKAHGIEEFILEPPALSADERLTSVELLARRPLSAAA